MFLANKLNKGAGVPTPKDAQFNYVTMLLHGDGTNGAQNNTFLDSSTNNFTITRNGNTTQGSFSPYGSNWSNYFNGSSDYLSLGTSTNLALGAGDFTIEVWLSVTAYNASTSNIFEWRSAGGTPSNIPTLYLSASGVPTFYASVGAGALITGSSAVALNTWTHLAIVRSGSTVTMYLNGTSVGSATNSADLGTQSFYINDPQGTFRHNGYFSNVRMVKGTAVYTGSFTPSTTPLTAITNTQLLTCQSNRFVDNSANAFSSTITGTPSVQRFNPFGASTAYDTSVIGGSGYFDGSGDYLSTANSSAFAFGTGNFTLEFWYKGTDNSGGLGLVTGGSTGYWQLNLFSSTMYWQDAVGASNLLSVNAIPILNDSWNHVAVVRNSTTLTIYFNGVSVTSATDTTNYSGTGGDFRLGFDSNSNYIAGYIADYRIVKGTAVYTANFTPPTAPLTAVTNTQLLLNTTNGAIFDNAMMNDLETVGNTQISTSVKKYGTGSLAFDGTGDYLSTRSTPNLSFGSGDFTIECWVYATSLGSYNAVFAQWPDNGGSANNSYTLETVGSNMEFYYCSGTTLYGPTTLGTITTGVWIHYAICRSGNTLYPFKNGVLGTTTSITQTLNSPTSAITVGGAVAGGGEWNGYIDDLRITKGYARYTSTFTPPTAAFPNIGPV